MENETLLRLEAVVQKMLGTINELKKSKLELEGQIHDRDIKIGELENKLAAVNSDQEKISSRVTSLISSIEEWEKNDMMGVEGPADIADVSDSALGSGTVRSESQLFDMGE
jgi:chromosome segregation ATPase